MASEPPFADEGIQPVPPDFVPSFPPVDAHSPDISEPSEVPAVALQPARPQPGFWLAGLATLFMFIVCQIAIPVVVAIVLMVVHSARGRDRWTEPGDLGTAAG